MALYNERFGFCIDPKTSVACLRHPNSEIAQEKRRRETRKWRSGSGKRGDVVIWEWICLSSLMFLHSSTKRAIVFLSLAMKFCHMSSLPTIGTCK